MGRSDGHPWGEPVAVNWGDPVAAYGEFPMAAVSAPVLVARCVTGRLVPYAASLSGLTCETIGADA
jgi:hypothetical protein